MTTVPVTGGQRLRVQDVLLAGETADGPALANIEALVVDGDGLTIVGPRPGVERLVPWAEISGFEGMQPASLPTGARASALALQVRGRALRFLLPEAAVPPGVVAVLERDIATHLAEAAKPHLSADAGTAPLHRGSPTPTMPPTSALHPLPDAGTAAVPVPPATVPVPPSALPVPPAAVPVPPAAVPVPPAAPRVVPFDAATGAIGGAAAAATAPADADEDEDVAVVAPPTDDLLMSKPATGRRERRRRGVRQSTTVVAKPLLAAEDFEYSSDPSLPRGGPGPGQVIEVSRPRRSARRLAVLFVVLVFLATGAGVWYYTKHATATPPRDTTRDLALAESALIGNPSQDPRLASGQTPDLPGWSTRPITPGNPFAMGAGGTAAAAQASAKAAGALASCLAVSPATLSAATGAGGSDTADRTAVVGSHLYGAPAGDPSTAASVTEVFDSSSVVQAGAKVFQNPSLFATCYEPYAQAMLPYVANLASGQKLDAATVQPMSVPAPAGRNVHAYGYQVTILGHSGANGFTIVLDDVAVLGGRVQTTLAMDSDVVFPVQSQASLVQAAEARVAAVAAR
jgi:hypothetical protein